MTKVNLSFYKRLLSEKEGMLKYIVRLGVPATDAEDLLFECYEKLALRESVLSRLSDEELRLYLGRSIHNASVNYHKKRSHEVLTDFNDNTLTTIAAASDQDPERIVIEKERTGQLREALSLISDDVRRLIVDHYILGKKYKELAEETGRKEILIRKEVSRAMKRLRTILGAKGLL